jgi:SAM-dependent methyltransferase
MAVRRALALGLGYATFTDPAASLLTRLRARLLLRRLRWDCLPWVGEGRYLDVGCGSGAALGAARALGWRVAGIEMNEAAAARARQFTEELYVGDILSAPIGAARFDVVTAFHVLEHLPDPVAALRRMLGWLDPDGLLVVEVPNAGGLGARLFGRAWSALELPRHLFHFSPETLARTVGLAGGRIVWCWHRAQPRHYLWSLRIALDDRGWRRLSKLTQAPAIHGAIKILLELVLPFISRIRRGEVIRVGVVPAASTGFP